MRTHYLFYAQAAMLLCIFSTHLSLNAQNPTPILEVSFMKSMPGEDYLRVEQDIWKPIHEERIARGQLQAWYLYQVRYPSGANAEYDYVTVNVYPSFNYLEAPFEDWEDIFETAHPGKNMDEVDMKTNKVRSLIRNEVYMMLSGTSADTRTEQAKFIFINYMKTAPEDIAAYLNMETSVFQPLHQASVDQKNMNGWGLYQLILPAGTGLAHNYTTVDGYDSFEQISRPAPDDLWASVHPGVSEEEMLSKITDIRSLVRRELWQLVDKVVAAPER